MEGSPKKVEPLNVRVEGDVTLALSAIQDQLSHAKMALYSDNNMQVAEDSLQIAESLFPYQEKIIEENNLESLRIFANALKERIRVFRINLNGKKSETS